MELATHAGEIFAFCNRLIINKIGKQSGSGKMDGGYCIFFVLEGRAPEGGRVVGPRAFLKEETIPAYPN